jgi:hypothetical protein
MPAETHQRREHVSAAEISELLVTILDLSTSPDAAGPVRLADVGCDDDLVLLDLWDAAVEEFGERTLGEPDLEELRAVATLGELAGLVADRCRAAGDTGGGDDRGDQP